MRIVHILLLYALLLIGPLAAAALPPGRLFDDALPSPRAFRAGRRRLAATPYGPPPSRLPRFAYSGGPPDAAGAWAAPNFVNFQSASGFVTSVYLGDTDSPFQQQMGRFESWECAGGLGRYIATSLRADTYQNGSVVVTPHCEVGQVNLETGLYFWYATTDGCPDPATVQFTDPSRRIASKSLPGAAKYVCTGAEGLGVDAPAGGPGLAPSVRAGTRNAGTTLPPPLDSSNADFPPVFGRKEGPNDLTGVWFSDAFATGELVAPDGSIASVGLMPDGTYTSVLVRFNSYKCVSGSPGAYQASISFTQTFQNLTTVSGAGCTAGAVAPRPGRGRYTWTPASDTACPALGSEPLFDMRRVLESDV